MEHSNGEVHERHAEVMVKLEDGRYGRIADCNGSATFIPQEIREANAKRIEALWSGANGMTTKKAGAYLKNADSLKLVLEGYIEIQGLRAQGENIPWAKELLTQLEENE